YIDTELDPRTGRILDIGVFREPNEKFHDPSTDAFKTFIQGVRYVCGHNIIHHDLKAIREAVESTCPGVAYIDTLYLSPLLFPARPYHALVKDDKLQVDEINNPLNDAMKARDLFHDEVTAFRALDWPMQELLFHLLHADEAFKGFFGYMDFRAGSQDVAGLLRTRLGDEICANAPIEKLMHDRPVDLAYAVVLILARDTYSIFPRWLTMTRPGVEQVFRILRSTPCIEGCAYCNRALDPSAGLKRF